MIRTLRGAWSRRATLLPLLLLTVVVVAGVVAVLGFAAAAGTSARLAGAAAGARRGRRARPPAASWPRPAAREIALARLRGLQGGRAVALASLEPLVVLVLGGAAGSRSAAWARGLAVAAWTAARPTRLAPAPPRRRRRGAIVASAWSRWSLGMARALREPLLDQVRAPTPRPRAARAGAPRPGAGRGRRRSSRSTAPAAAGATPTAGRWPGPPWSAWPLGQVGVWLVQSAGPALAAPDPPRRGLRGFLAVRRLARVADAAGAVRLLVAAAVVAAARAHRRAARSTAGPTTTARLRAGGPLQVAAPTPTPPGVAEPDPPSSTPTARWLMAAVLVPGEGSVTARRAFLDLPVTTAVVGDFYAGPRPPPPRRAGVVDDLRGRTRDDGAGGDAGRRAPCAASADDERRDPAAGQADLPDGVRREPTATLQLDLPLTGRAGHRDDAGSSGLRGRLPPDASVVLAAEPGRRPLPWVLADVAARRRRRARPPAGEPAEPRGAGAPVVVDEGLLASATACPPGRGRPRRRPGGPRHPQRASGTDVRTRESPGGDSRAGEVLSPTARAAARRGRRPARRPAHAAAGCAADGAGRRGAGARPRRHPHRPAGAPARRRRRAPDPRRRRTTPPWRRPGQPGAGLRPDGRLLSGGRRTGPAHGRVAAAARPGATTSPRCARSAWTRSAASGRRLEVALLGRDRGWRPRPGCGSPSGCCSLTCPGPGPGPRRRPASPASARARWCWRAGRGRWLAVVVLGCGRSVEPARSRPAILREDGGPMKRPAAPCRHGPARAALARPALGRRRSCWSRWPSARPCWARSSRSPSPTPTSSPASPTPRPADRAELGLRPRGRLDPRPSRRCAVPSRRRPQPSPSGSGPRPCCRSDRWAVARLGGEPADRPGVATGRVRAPRGRRRLPGSAGEVLMLAGDAEARARRRATPSRGAPGWATSPWSAPTAVPAGAADYWFDLGRFASAAAADRPPEPSRRSVQRRWSPFRPPSAGARLSVVGRWSTAAWPCPSTSRPTTCPRPSGRPVVGRRRAGGARPVDGGTLDPELDQRPARDRHRGARPAGHRRAPRSRRRCSRWCWSRSPCCCACSPRRPTCACPSWPWPRCAGCPGAGCGRSASPSRWPCSRCRAARRRAGRRAWSWALVRAWLVPGLPVPCLVAASLAAAAGGLAAVGGGRRGGGPGAARAARRPAQRRTPPAAPRAGRPWWPSWRWWRRPPPCWPASCRPAARATRTSPTWCCRCCSPWSPGSPRPG